jgi:NAD(P)-dependent dehydrogenase (short-subunit alcohol dehydrogenase family)
MTRFKAAKKQYGRIDHVFANAGVSMTTTFLEDDVDENGDLLPPNLKTMNVNLIGCLYTVKLGIHHLRKDSRDSSIVVTASGSSFTRFPTPDYSTPASLLLPPNTSPPILPPISILLLHPLFHPPTLTHTQQPPNTASSA